MTRIPRWSPAWRRAMRSSCPPPPPAPRCQVLATPPGPVPGARSSSGGEGNMSGPTTQVVDANPSASGREKISDLLLHPGIAAAEPPVIRIQGVTKIYHLGDTTVHALRGVDLDVR